MWKQYKSPNYTMLHTIRLHGSITEFMYKHKDRYVRTVILYRSYYSVCSMNWYGVHVFTQCYLLTTMNSPYTCIHLQNNGSMGKLTRQNNNAYMHKYNYNQAHWDAHFRTERLYRIDHVCMYESVCMSCTLVLIPHAAVPALHATS